MEKQTNITRQIDTGVGLIVGGVVGWFHHQWYVWLFLFGILVAWYYSNKTLENVGKI